MLGADAMLTSLAVAGLAIVLLVAFALDYAIVFPRHHRGDEPTALSRLDADLAGRLDAHLKAIASRPHNLFYPDALEASALQIEARLGALGLVPARQVFKVDGHDVRNIEVTFEPQSPDEGPQLGTIVIGAHYDSPDDSPGANDNGTGVAALIELARLMTEMPPPRHRIRLVFFVNEEAPWCKTPDMGSWQHALRLRRDGERVVGMIALETLGYFSSRPGTQAFPTPFNWVYSDRGDFVAFVGLPRSRSFLRTALAAFRETGAFPSIGGVAPGFIPGIDLSDHWAYDQHGFPALMITDTAPFRNPYYHQTNDTPDTVDTASLARIVVGLAGMVRKIG
ncbi:MAG: M28 family peptidase [Hyphomicrobiaceae bacterium]|nr:M28 family peptidase [Hyphomicrobiaceae bacterium]